ncbi:MAG: acyl-CoA dehydrogenase family protein [Candidatus Marsarchaeota archaeon]|nr:acyl-CoA dehydrogenase family protein [Candidatus Marsarchaeota archaeon]
MEKLLENSINDLGKLYDFSKEELKVLEDADKAADELSESEFEHYIKREVNPDHARVLSKYNVLGVPISEKYGGRGCNPLISVLVKERLGQLGMGLSSFVNVQMFLGEMMLERWGTEAQKSKYLADAVGGKKIIAYGLTEPEAGSDPSAMQTTYEKKGNKYILNGSKYLITNGSIADIIIIFARAKDNPKEHSAFIVDTKSPGFSISMRMEEKIGLFTSDTAMPELENVEVGEDDVFGGIGMGMHVAYSGLMNGRTGVASASVGVIDACLSAVVERASERVQHGKEIGKHQLIQNHIAEIRQNLEMARWPVYFAAIRKADYEKDPTNKDLIEELDFRISLAKKIASRLAFESADRAVQVFGGFGYSILSPVGRLFCDSRVARIYEGTDEIQTLKIAEGVLGKDFAAFK